MTNRQFAAIFSLILFFGSNEIHVGNSLAIYFLVIRMVLLLICVIAAYPLLGPWGSK